MSERRAFPRAGQWLLPWRATDQAAAGGGSLRRNASLVPVASIAGRSLITVVAIMSFLCALAAGAALLIAGASRDWQRSIASEVTIQIKPQGGNTDADVARAADLARATPGVERVEVYDKQSSEQLLEPWLGSGLNLDDLPVPRMIAVKLAHSGSADLDTLRKELATAVNGASLDDHQMWFSWLATMADTVVLIALGVFGLVLAAMFLTVAFATRGAMAGNGEIIGVLHFVGADDAFIAREFQRHFLRLGLRGGLVGGFCAILLFLTAGAFHAYYRSTPGGDQLEALFGSFALGWRGYLAIVAISLSIAVATGLISRAIVVRTLRRLS